MIDYNCRYLLITCTNTQVWIRGCTNDIYEAIDYMRVCNGNIDSFDVEIYDQLYNHWIDIPPEYYEWNHIFWEELDYY